ncbi:hypothetical protein ORD22_03350 [Sporosarcina sp. GW1-11]|uniref:immunoglobulin-like domain-containing protein n=1 Tax=Sporosarcina sp. GW1-11 TaxID=2899126 RepID=UPI00294E8926|nr:immunoglobulin-like domain-containing protein [Sporosarcina sp. GW1-11]MDV6377296.1 hypothetical protein [Sporosarcina sp. GW1-11]
MKKWLFLVSTLFLLASCGNEQSITTLVDPVPNQVIPSESEGISLKLLQHEFAEPPTHIETKVINANADAFEIGPFYHIEVLKDDLWYILTYSDAVFLRDPQFRDGGMVLEGHQEIQQTFSVEKLGISLPVGTYRLVKTVLQHDPYHEVTVAVPFTVQ